MNATCAHCGAPFAMRKATSRFCSKRCSGLAQNEAKRASGEHEARYWANVQRGADGDCWPWLASKSEGYGQIRFAGEKLGSHVVSYRLAYGEVPPGLMVLHRCGNRECCNPAHLYAGNYADNTKDAVGHGTHVCNFGRGTSHIGSKLTPDQVRAIRDALARGQSQRSIAEQMGVGQQTISAINLGETWRHVA